VSAPPVPAVQQRLPLPSADIGKKRSVKESRGLLLPKQPGRTPSAPLLLLAGLVRDFKTSQLRPWTTAPVVEPKCTSLPDGGEPPLPNFFRPLRDKLREKAVPHPGKTDLTGGGARSWGPTGLTRGRVSKGLFSKKVRRVGRDRRTSQSNTAHQKRSTFFWRNLTHGLTRKGHFFGRPVQAGFCSRAAQVHRTSPKRNRDSITNIDRYLSARASTIGRTAFMVGLYPSRRPSGIRRET